MLGPLALVLLASLTSGVARADTWMAFADKRVASPSGRRYVVIRAQEHGSVDFELCERRTSLPPLKNAETSSPLGGKAAVGEIDRDPRDRLLASGTVKHLPYDVHVLDSGGFVLFETHYSFGRANTITYVDDAGKVVTQKKLPDIYGAVPSGTTHSVSSTWWERGHWIDEQRRSVVVISKGDEIREVLIDGGKISTPEITTFVRWCRVGSTENRSIALEVLSRQVEPADTLDDTTRSLRRRIADRVIVPAAEGIVADPKEPLALRLRAAIVLTRANRPGNYAPMFLEGIKARNTPADRRFATAHLPVVLGVDAIPILRELMRGEASVVWASCQEGFIALGERAVPTLIEILEEAGTSSDYRGGAAHALGEIRSAAAIPALFEAAATAEEYIANAAINAAIATGAPDLADRLIALLARGSTQDGRIAMYFERAPNREAIPALEAALNRCAPDDFETDWFRKAIAACRKK